MKIDELRELLTKEQLDQLFESMFGHASEEFLGCVLSDVGPEIAKVVTLLQHAADNSPEDSLPVNKIDQASEEKFIHKWSDLNIRLSDYIYELGDEEGDYCTQDQHWSKPEFDCYAFSNDLNKVFKEMLPLLTRAHELELEEADYFDKLLEEIRDGRGSYPEWMGAEYEDVEVEESGGDCMVTWKWLNRESVPGFVADVEKLLASAAVYFTKWQVPSFVEEATDDDLGELYDYLGQLENETAWGEKFADVKSFWHILFHGLAEMRDHDRFVVDSSRLVSRNWRYGIPVYKQFAQDGECEKAMEYCALTLGELVRQEGGCYSQIPWELTEDLLINRIDAFTHGSEPLDVLESWLKLAESLQNDDLAGALKIQIGFYKNPNDWDALKGVFENAITPCKEKLLEGWGNYALRTFVHQRGTNGERYNWLFWLIRAVISSHPNCFLEPTREFLSGGVSWEEPMLSSVKFELLTLLSRHLLSASDYSSNYPMLMSYLNGNKGSGFIGQVFGSSGSTDADSALKAWLDLVEADVLGPEVIACWKRSMKNLIPEPANGDYPKSALWLAICRELNEDVYQKTLARWRVVHKLKRNLWRDLGKFGITRQVTV